MVVLGKVREKYKDETIKVEISRNSACGGKCKDCSGNCASKSYIKCKNVDNADIGDVVCLKTEDKKVLFLSFVVFCVPLIVIFLVYYFIQCVKLPKYLLSVVPFFVGLLSFIVIIIFFRKLKMPCAYLYYIEKTKTYKNIDLGE